MKNAMRTLFCTLTAVAVFLLVVPAGASIVVAQEAALIASNAQNSDRFGNSVSISGDTAIVGSPYRSRAYIYILYGGTWTLQAEITPSNGHDSFGTSVSLAAGASDDYFGTSVSLSGDTALIGAWGHASTSGAAYVFTRSGSAWNLQTEFTGYHHYFGYAVSLDRDSAIVGSFNYGGYVFT